ncbi:MAG: TonB family protein [Gemmatimonadales bacterium]
MPFDILPPRSRFWDPGAVTSLVIHTLLVLPLVIGAPIADAGGDPVEQLVTFLVPPNREVGRAEKSQGVQWSSVEGTGGATEEELPVVAEPVEELPLGTAGDTVAAEPEVPSAPAVDETALTEIEVDSVVARDPTSAAPVYPPELLAKEIEGSTFVNYVVDTTGQVDLSTIRIVSTTRPEFAEAVRVALAQMKFRPAIQASRVVRQWVQQNFAFRIVRPAQQRPDTTSSRST